ncbi:MAG TPA: long-chain-acyl-CoA synthetase [Gammaproteobacteria bacterium]|jgi:citronellyl-CoA synthetase|nr:long-chain-acyl-CoA synthetase [Gammaproteobacteria bacterium]MCO4829565.1 long-chain-acyl-CoA synthetase [Gammaproteobacteria bacterium]MDB2328428.1 long-chain-acyl-CoA synthetase [Pseudomonadales bacterium]MDC3343752.1 long-chain-acyl-CoA synthetase [Pseudomonadales bacterium]HAJ28780.1 long-chain-acyl-CoA synthetase [Gammaproteobacteria bacterium]
MGIVDVVSVLSEMPTLLKLKKGMVPRPASVADCFGARVEANALKFGQRSAIVFEGQEVNWSEFNALANRYAHYLKSQGVQRGDTVSVIMENRIEFLALLVGVNKIGVTAGLINTNLTGKPLVHCITVTHSKKCIFGSEVSGALNEVKDELGLTEGEDYFEMPDGGLDATTNWAKNLAEGAAAASSENPEETSLITLGEVALYIFTSGTTGLPKAAVLSNRRYLTSADMAAMAGFKCTEQDRMYICLPLYHGTGLMVGAGAAMVSGASMFIRRKFSASNFLPEVREHGCTLLVYIGELCRYLSNTEAQAGDDKNPLRSMMGNGMRPDVWLGFKKRFGISRVAEFYGASEGNVAFANLMNRDCTVGMTSAEVALVEYDVDNDEIVRDAAGRCVPVKAGEPGLLLGKITEDTVFEGYTDPEATEKKIVRSALETDDAWFNSGDLMRTVDVGFTLGYPHYQFVDRVGDTFRWKSENVSTNEVGEIINGFDQIKFCNVYGVEIPGTDGRAGMAAVTLQDGVAELDVDAFSTFLRSELPAYAVPLFVRIQPDIDVTGTFKMVKGDLRKQAYDIRSFDDTVYALLPGSDRYAAFDLAMLEKIEAREAGF